MRSPGTHRRGRPGWRSGYGLLVGSAFSLLDLAPAAALHAAAQRGSGGNEWASYAADGGNSKYSPLAQIDRTNVTRLRVAWRLPSLDYGAAERHRGIVATPILETTPLFVSGRLLLNSGAGLAAALEPSSGELLWLYDPYARGEQLDRASYAFLARGGAVWRRDRRERFLFTSNGALVALDTRTGEPDPGFGQNGKADLRQLAGGESLPGFFWTSPPMVCGDTIVVGSSTRDNSMRRKAAPGTVRGYDAATGARLWQFNIIPRPGEAGYETWLEGSADWSGHANVWSFFGCDPELGLVYAPTTTPNNDWYGGHRPGAGLYGESIVALEARTGKKVWHFQAVHHGLWDYDFPAGPILADLMVGGRPIPALVQVSKQAFLYVFDRRSGEPVWPIVELPVPHSRVPGERAFPTQPHPTWPKAFDLQGLRIDDLVDFTPELRAAAMRRLEGYLLGPLFLPPELRTETFRGSIQSPSAIGATAWNSAALDPETNTLYLPSVTALLVADLQPPDPNRSDFAYTFELARGGGEHVQFPGGLPITKPPYGRITAIDLDTGNHLWVVPNGDGPRHHPLLAGLDLPALGQTGRASALVTKTLLFAGEGSPDMVGVPEGGGGRMFRAFDKATGAVLWTTELPAGVTSAPMTYQHAGRQYLVVACGDRSHPAELVAFALPDDARPGSR